MATVVNKGLEMIAKLIGGVSTDKMQYVALGSGTTDEANDQTALVAEITTNGGKGRQAHAATSQTTSSR